MNSKKTLEVPKTINVRVSDGIIESLDARASVSRLLFQHVYDSLNDKNDIEALKELASVHGLAIEFTD